MRKIRNYSLTILKSSRIKPFIWVFSTFFIAYFLNSCSDTFQSPEGSSGSNSSINNLTELGQIGYDETSLVRVISYNSGTTHSASGFGAGTSTSTGRTSQSNSGGYASGGGQLDQGVDSESSTSSITYDNYDGKGFHYFEKMTEPENAFVSEGEAFALQFVAIGRFPLKYVWYREGTMGRQVVGTDSTVFSKISASRTDAGVYYATVQDREGNTLTSRKVTLSIRPSDNSCSAGNYGKLGATFDELVSENYVPTGYRNWLVQLPYKRGTYTAEVSCENYRSSLLTTCTGTLTYQCIDGKYKRIDGECVCSDNGGN